MSTARNLTNDRVLGDRWEREFIRIAELFGFKGWQVTPMRGPMLEWRGQRFISPDVWLTNGTAQYACEVKHKAPTDYGTIGLEVYRANSLVSLQEHSAHQNGGVTVLYVIHDWSLNGTRANERNIIHHWYADTTNALQQRITLTREGPTWRNGKETIAPINYYAVAPFRPLLEFLT